MSLEIERAPGRDSDSRYPHSPGRRKARCAGLHDILLYHMVVSDLYAAGCPSGRRLTQYPEWPSREEAAARIEEALPYLPYIRNTSSFWGCADHSPPPLRMAGAGR